MSTSLAVLVWGLCSPCRAQYTLDYVAHEACPGEQHFVDAVVARLGADPFSGGRATLEVRAAQAGAHQFRVHLLLAQGELASERTFNSRRCAEGIDAAAVAFSVLFAEIERQGSVEQSWDAPPDWPEPTPAATRSPDPPPKTKPQPEPQTGFGLGVFAGGGLEVGRFATLSPIASVGLSVGDLAHWLRLQFWYATTFGEAALDRESSASLSGYGGAAGLCVRFGWPLVCTDFEFGAASVHASSLQPSSDTALYSAWTLEAGAYLEVSEGIALAPVVRVGVPLSPPEIFVADESRWHAAPLFTGVAFRLSWRPA